MTSPINVTFSDNHKSDQETTAKQISLHHRIEKCRQDLQISYKDSSIDSEKIRTKLHRLYTELNG